MKARGLEPSVPAVVAACPEGTRNPETGEAFTAKVILQVFRTRCFDPGAEIRLMNQLGDGLGAGAPMTPGAT